MFSDFLHLLYRWSGIIACVIGAVAFLGVVLALRMGKGSLKERWRNTGGGT